MRSASRVSLAVEGLRRGGWLRLQVRGESMLPSLGPGDIVEIEACSLRDICSGDIILAHRDERLFLHRFVARFDSNRFLTRGDSMARPDPRYDAGAFLGKAVGVIRNGVRVTAPLQPRAWYRPLGWLCCYNSWVRYLTLKLGWSTRPAAAAAIVGVVET
jgi:signal peptidase I